MLRNLRMVVTLSITSAWVTQGLLFIIMWAHSFSGHKLVSHTDTVLLTLSLGQSFEPVIQLLHSTSNLQATVNTWYVSPLFFFWVCWRQRNFHQFYHLKIKVPHENYLWSVELSNSEDVCCSHFPWSFLFFFFFFDLILFRSDFALLTGVPSSVGPSLAILPSS